MVGSGRLLTFTGPDAEADSLRAVAEAKAAKAAKPRLVETKVENVEPGSILYSDDGDLWEVVDRPVQVAVGAERTVRGFGGSGGGTSRPARSARSRI